MFIRFEGRNKLFGEIENKWGFDSKVGVRDYVKIMYKVR